MPLTTVSPGMLDTTAQYYGFKNRIINGAMVIDQRNAGASVNTSSSTQVYTLDRWIAVYSATSKYTVQQNAASVTPPAGFTNYLGVTSSAATSVGASDYYFLGQVLEGFSVADLGFGTANAQTVTVSFWVHSSLTGTFGGVLKNDSTFSYPFNYTINAANTWEQKSITIIGQTSGTWDKTNSAGMRLFWSLGVGSTFSGTANAWASGNLFAPTGATSVVGTSGATFYITGVQLEKGSTATSFDYRPYGTELALCQRYYEVYYQDTGGVWPTAAYYNGSNFFSYWAFKVEKRAQATVTRVGGTWSGATPTIYNGISSSSFFASVAFYMNATAGTKCLEAAAEL